MTPGQVNNIVASVLKSHFPHWDIQCLPLSDGGDGWLEAMSASNSEGYQEKSISVLGPIPSQQVSAQYLWSAKNRQLLIEAAEIHGMRRLPQSKRAPLTATAYGVGEAFQQLVQRHPEAVEIILSVGGSASIDGGFGFLQAMGWQFYDASGGLLPAPLGGGNLPHIQRVVPYEMAKDFPAVTLLVDVETPFADAPKVFGPQKGASPLEVEMLTQAFQRVGKLADPEQHFFNQPGTGAAGGLSFGVLMGCPKVMMLPGIEWVAQQLQLDSHWADADLIITGEGRFDETSLMGKGTGYLIQQARQSQKPLIILCGQNTASQSLPPNITVWALSSPNDPVSQQDLAAAPAKLRQLILAKLSTIEQMLASPQAEN